MVLLSVAWWPALLLCGSSHRFRSGCCGFGSSRLPGFRQRLAEQQGAVAAGKGSTGGLAPLWGLLPQQVLASKGCCDGGAG